MCRCACVALGSSGTLSPHNFVNLGSELGMSDAGPSLSFFGVKFEIFGVQPKSLLRKSTSSCFVTPTFAFLYPPTPSKTGTAC